MNPQPQTAHQEIKEFAGTRTIFGAGFKMIILDEADNMTNAAQVLQLERAEMRERGRERERERREERG